MLVALSGAGRKFLSPPAAVGITGSAVFRSSVYSPAPSDSNSRDSKVLSLGIDNYPYTSAGFLEQPSAASEKPKTSQATMAPSAEVDTVTPGRPRERLPVLFLSHGSPFSAFTDNEDAAFWRELGAQVKKLPGLRAVLMVSGHWEEWPVRVNTTEKPETIYDFYGFPAHFYKAKYPGVGQPEVARRVLEVLASNGVPAKADPNHGLDHGSWVPLRWMLPGGEIPVVQMSLIDGGNMADHVHLGRALAPLREEGILIVGSGTAVHNLRDLRFSRQTPDDVAPYVAPFDEALEKAVCGDLSESEREKRLLDLGKHPLLRKAHPSLEHLLPLHVAGGAAGSDPGKKIFHKHELSFSNASFAFGSGFSF